eukprot:2223352-Alexandrium_andersonii.AAC.1
MAPIGTRAGARILGPAPRTVAPCLPLLGAPSLIPTPFGSPQTTAHPSGRRARRRGRLANW